MRFSLLLGALALSLGSVTAEDSDPLIEEKPLSQLLKQLRSDNRGLQLRASQALAKAPAEHQSRILPQVVPLLKSERENDRFVAAQVLGEYGPLSRPAVGDLLPLLEGTQFERNRATAAKALGQILKDAQPSEEVEKVALALARKFTENFDNYSDVRREAVRALGMIGPAAKKIIPQLDKALKDRPNDLPEFLMIRQEAAWTCGRMGPLAAQHVDLLISLLRSEGGEPGIPQYYEALGRIGPLKDETLTKNVVMNIVDRLEIAHNHGLVWQVGFWAAGEAGMRALQNFGPKAAPAVPFLAKLLSADGARLVVLTELCRTLGAIGPAAQEAIPRLEAMAAYKPKQYADSDPGRLGALHEAAKTALAAIRR